MQTLLGVSSAEAKHLFALLVVTALSATTELYAKIARRVGLARSRDHELFRLNLAGHLSLL
jgi:hypothetical protein